MRRVKLAFVKNTFRTYLVRWVNFFSASIALKVLESVLTFFVLVSLTPLFFLCTNTENILHACVLNALLLHPWTQRKHSPNGPEHGQLLKKLVLGPKPV